MKKIPAYIEYKDEDNTVKDDFFTYSEVEKQNNEVNKSNSSLLFTPEFIPFYPKYQKKYNLTDKATLLFGFIKFYLSNSKSGRFYFDNEQLAELMGCSDRHISNLMRELKEKTPININYKPKANGGTIRFINSKEFRHELQFSSDTNYSSVPTRTTVLPNNNKIRENKKNKSNTGIALNAIRNVEGSSSNEVNHLIATFEPVNPSFSRLFANKTERAAVERLIKQHTLEKLQKIMEVLPDIVNMPFAPRITTPLQLEKDLGKLQIFMAQAQGVKSQKRGGVYDATGN